MGAPSGRQSELLTVKATEQLRHHGGGQLGVAVHASGFARGQVASGYLKDRTGLRGAGAADVRHGGDIWTTYQHRTINRSPFHGG